MAMFWAFLIITALAVGLFQLGALSVWVAVLKIGLLLAAFLICFMVVATLWRGMLSGIKRIPRLY